MRLCFEKSQCFTTRAESMKTSSLKSICFPASIFSCFGINLKGLGGLLDFSREAFGGQHGLRAFQSFREACFFNLFCCSVFFYAFCSIWGVRGRFGGRLLKGFGNAFERLWKVLGMILNMWQRRRRQRCRQRR